MTMLVSYPWQQMIWKDSFGCVFVAVFTLDFVLSYIYPLGGSFSVVVILFLVQTTEDMQPLQTPPTQQCFTKRSRP